MVNEDTSFEMEEECKKNKKGDISGSDLSILSFSFKTVHNKFNSFKVVYCYTSGLLFKT